MKKMIDIREWKEEAQDDIEVNSIGTDFFLFDDSIITPQYSYPFKVDMVVGIICIEGESRGKINLRPYATYSPGFAVILPGQIIEYEYISADFKALVVAISPTFTESLHIAHGLTLFFSVREQPFVTLTQEESDAMRAHYAIMQRAVSKKENPYRAEAVKSLIEAFFYSMGHQFHKTPSNTTKNKAEILLDTFFKHLQADFRNQRSINYYAKKIGVTPKYLSKVVKEVSSKSGNDWINSYVILEAKALLKSSDKTIQQISNELNFPSQSFFGKYFKRHTGISPKEYRNN